MGKIGPIPSRSLLSGDPEATQEAGLLWRTDSGCGSPVQEPTYPAWKVSVLPEGGGDLDKPRALQAPGGRPGRGRETDAPRCRWALRTSSPSSLTPHAADKTWTTGPRACLLSGAPRQGQEEAGRWPEGRRAPDARLRAPFQSGRTLRGLEEPCLTRGFGCRGWPCRGSVCSRKLPLPRAWERFRGFLAPLARARPGKLRSAPLFTQVTAPPCKHTWPELTENFYTQAESSQGSSGEKGSPMA
ncbi:uncharacterized protein LOC127558304 [Antechinus flavipes]|uniref:uncharacterized protein LOC127558304 n=1 Tax=Antechinus flavipes TaxID=38775 RepID=UPI0022360B06|nr:uncharacterized protein LOC127558304 [Antechinus flavipes]